MSEFVSAADDTAPVPTALWVLEVTVEAEVVKAADVQGEAP